MAYTKEQAWELLTQYNKGEFHLKHANTVADVMRWYAEKLGYGDEADFWEIVGLLHDLDFEMYPDEHCIKSQEIMRENGLDERLLRATARPGYGLHVDGLTEQQAQTRMEAAQALHGDICWYDGATDQHYENGHFYKLTPPPPMINMIDLTDYHEKEE